MRNNFPKRTSDASLHTLSKAYRWLCKPPSFDAVYHFLYGRQRVAVTRHCVTCLVKQVLRSESTLSITTKSLKMEIPYMSSCKSSKEGDFPLCILPKREILRETILWHLFLPATFKLKTMRYCLRKMVLNSPYDAKALYFCTLWSLCWLYMQYIFIGKSNTIHPFKRKSWVGDEAKKERVFHF